MADEKQFTIPLRKSFVKVPVYKRTEKALKGIKYFILRHMKADEVKIGQHLNLHVWKHGRKNPPVRVKVKSIKEEINGKTVAHVELPEFEFPKKKEVKVKEEKKKPEQKQPEQKEAVKKQVEEKEKERKIEKELEHEGKIVEKETTKGKKVKPSEQEAEKEVLKQKDKRAFDEHRSSHE